MNRKKRRRLQREFNQLAFLNRKLNRDLEGIALAIKQLEVTMEKLHQFSFTLSTELADAWKKTMSEVEKTDEG